VQDRPTAGELLETIAWVLEDDILPVLEGAKQHQVRIAINLCRILQREWELAPQADAEEARRLATLLGRASETDGESLNRVLCECLERGEDLALEALALPILLANVRAKLAVAKPGHDAYDFAEELNE
jgi:hypothetical protein